MRPRRGALVSVDESDAVLLIWRYQKHLRQTLRVIDDADPNDVIHMVEYDFAKWREIPRETTRAVLEDYLEDPKKYEELLASRESGRIRAPEGEPYKPGDLTAAADRLIRTTGGRG